jgi:hypothetical protein
VQGAPVPPQQMVLVPLPGPSAQILFVLSVQHCSLVVQKSPAARGRHRLHRRRRLRLAASVSPESAASPTSATVDAVAAPNADLRVVRRVLDSPTSRVSASNCDPSTATSDLGDAPASPVSTKRRPIGRQLPARRKEARSHGVGRAHGFWVVTSDDPDIIRYTAPVRMDAPIRLRPRTKSAQNA